MSLPVRRLLPCALQIAIAGLLVATSTGQGTIPSFSGTWSLDSFKTTARYISPSAALKIEQSGPQLSYQYFENGVLKYAGILIIDGKERERYKTKVDRVYYRARWVKGELVISTRGFQDAMGTQTYSYSDRWAVSDDGNTLTHIYDDKKVAVFRRGGNQSYLPQGPAT